MLNEDRGIAERDPLLLPANLASDAVSVPIRLAAADSNFDGRIKAQRLQATIPCLLCFFCLVIGDSLTSTPAMQIREDLICRGLFPDLPADTDLSRDPACKSSPVQAELALVNGWELTSLMLPGILTGVPWGVVADRRGRARVLRLATVGLLLSLLWQIVVHSFPHALPLRLVWLQGAFLLLGGGTSTFGALLYTIVADDVASAGDGGRAAALLRLGTAANAATLLGGPVTYFAMERGGAWFATYLGVAAWLLAFALTAAIPETRSDAAVKRAAEQMTALQKDDGGAMESIWWDVRPLASSAMRQAGMVADIIFRNNITLGILLFSTVFTTLGRAGDTLQQQYAVKRFGWTMAETSFLASVKGIVNLVLTAAVLPAISQILLTKFKLPPVVKDWWMTIGSLCMTVLGGACLTAAGSSSIFVGSLVILQLGGGYEFAFRSMTSEMVDPSHIAVLFTAYSVFMLLSEVAAGPVLAAVFREGLDLGGKWVALPFFVVTILFCVTLIITCTVRLGKHLKSI